MIFLASPLSFQFIHNFFVESFHHSDHLIPPDSRVEIDAKIAAGYFSSTKNLTEADLVKTVGRTWEETEH